MYHKINTAKLKKVLQANPDATFSDLHGNMQNSMSSRSFSLYKKKFKAFGEAIPVRVSKHRTKLDDREGLISTLKSNPEISFKECLDKGHRISLSTYSRYRKKVQAGMKGLKERYTTAKKARRSLYQTVWSHSTDNLPKVAKDLLTSFVDGLNESGRCRFETVERVNPNVLEVRETTV